MKISNAVILVLAVCLLGLSLLHHASLKPTIKQEAPLFAAHPMDVATLYPLVDLATVADGKWGRPRAKIVGTVEDVHHEADGDWHFRIGSGGKFLICEIIPEMPMSHPAVGDKVVVYGIVREDSHHGWWEIHPVTKWEKSP